MPGSDDDRTTLARLIPTAQRLANDQDELITWLATLNDHERAVILAWAQQQGLHWSQALSRVDDVFKRISDDQMP